MNGGKKENKEGERKFSKKKGDSMRKKIILSLIMVSVSFFLFLAWGNAWAAELKVGDEAPGFIVASTLDKEIDYYRDYY
jgi:hypothetical protein